MKHRANFIAQAPLHHHSTSHTGRHLNVRSARERSEYTSQIIDQEVKVIIDLGYNTAKSILTKHLKQLHLLANSLIEHETLSGEQIKDLLDGKKIEVAAKPKKAPVKKETVKAAKEEKETKPKKPKKS